MVDSNYAVFERFILAYVADEAYVAYVDLRGLTWLTWTYETNEAYEAYVDLCVALGGLVRSCHSGAV